MLLFAGLHHLVSQLLLRHLGLLHNHSNRVQSSLVTKILRISLKLCVILGKQKIENGAQLGLRIMVVHKYVGQLFILGITKGSCTVSVLRNRLPLYFHVGQLFILGITQCLYLTGCLYIFTIVNSKGTTVSVLTGSHRGHVGSRIEPTNTYVPLVNMYLKLSIYIHKYLIRRIFIRTSS